MRIFFFLKDGIHPTVQLDTFITQQTGNEFSWTGLEIIYDWFASQPLELVLFLSWFVFLWPMIPIMGWQDRNRQRAKELRLADEDIEK